MVNTAHLGTSKCYNKQLTIDLSLRLKCIKNHFKNYCKVIQKRTSISYYWSIDNSCAFFNKIADIKTAHSIKTFDFSTLYTNLPLDVIIPLASTKLKGGYTGITLSVCPSVDRIVSALYLQQYSSDPFHICTSYQATSEGVSRVMPVSKFKNLKFWRIF